MTGADIGPPSGEEMTVRERQMRGTVAAIIVLLAHLAGIALVLSSRTERLEAVPRDLPGKSIAVSLVSQAAPRPVPAPPVAEAVRESTPSKLTKEAPVGRKAPQIVASQNPSTRAVQQPEERDKAPSRISPPQTLPPPTAAPSTAAAESTPTQAADSQASHADSLALPKVWGAEGLHQLGCQIPQPIFPAKAKRLQQSGTVVLRVTISLDGRISDVAVAHSSGYDLLDAAALDAIRMGSCKPYVENGHPRVVQATQAIAFSLDD